MKKLFYIALVGIVTTIAVAACSQDDPEDVRSQMEEVEGPL